MSPLPLPPRPAWPPSIGRALAMLGVYLGSMLVLGSVFSVVDLLTGEFVGALVAQSAAMVFAAVVTLALSRAVLCLDWRSAIRRAGGRVPGGVWAPVIVLFAAGYPLVVQIALITHLLLPMPEFLSKLFDELLGAQDQVLPAFLLLTVIAPLVEEFVCRGWLMPALLDRWRPSRAIALTALIFGLMHLNPWQFFYAFYLGLWLGWVYARTRSIWPCVAGHAMNNGLAWLMTLLSPADSELGGSNLQSPELLPWPVVLLSLLAVIAAAAWLRRAARTA
ncbi:MAG: CPBP family intramembrane metalloprotease [Verrucomicrobia bacterium]|nr:CPBP family intramembrane metalloprotease [Verrucomicrobiota bacterium]